MLFLSCSREEGPFNPTAEEFKPDKQAEYVCLDEDKYGNCLDGGVPILLPEIVIVPPGAGGGSGIGDLWLEMLPSMSTLSNGNGGGSSDSSNLSNGDQVDQHSPPYLNVQKILNDSLIVATLQEIFIEVTQSASEENGRREAGAYIFYDEAEDKLYVGNVKYGEYVQGGVGTNGSVSLGSGSVRSNSDENNVIPLTAKPIVAFHTHTPMTYLPKDDFRKVGFSPADFSFANQHHVPLILLDYIGKEGTDGNFYLYGGHAIGDPSNFIIYYPKNNEL